MKQLIKKYALKAALVAGLLTLSAYGHTEKQPPAGGCFVVQNSDTLP